MNALNMKKFVANRSRLVYLDLAEKAGAKSHEASILLGEYAVAVEIQGEEAARKGETSITFDFPDDPPLDTEELYDAFKRALIDDMRVRGFDTTPGFSLKSGKINSFKMAW